MPVKRTIASCLLLLFLAACSITPPPSDTPAVLSRLDALERSVLDLCAYRDVRMEAQFVGLGEVQERVTEVHEYLVGQGGSRQPSTAPECTPGAGTDIGDKLVLGRAEWVGLPSLGSYFKARLDTGANTSSLSAKDIRPFERDGENWVRFRLALSENDAVVPAVLKKEFEARVVRQVRIIQASGSDRRPVIRLPMTLGTIEQNVEFTLNDRRHLTYPVLLGRRFMMDIAVIDISRNYIHPRPEFPGGKPAASAARDQRDDDAAEEE
jgi:hypothetical protein